MPSAIAMTSARSHPSQRLRQSLTTGECSGSPGRTARRERARQSLDGLLAQLDLHGGRELTAALRFIAARSFSSGSTWSLPSACRGAGVAFRSQLAKELRLCLCRPPPPGLGPARGALLALLVGGQPACGARTDVETPGPIASAAAAASADAGDGAAAARDGGAGDGNLENGRAIAPGRRAASATTQAAPALERRRRGTSPADRTRTGARRWTSRHPTWTHAPASFTPIGARRKRGDAYWVRAAADGYFTAVLRKGCPCVQIQHDDGTTTNYFHLRRSSVKRLGVQGRRIRCGRARPSAIRRARSGRGNAGPRTRPPACTFTFIGRTRPRPHGSPPTVRRSGAGRSRRSAASAMGC